MGPKIFVDFNFCYELIEVCDCKIREIKKTHNKFLLATYMVY